MIQLSKIVPARRQTIKFVWLKRDWIEMSENFRRIRSGLKNKLDRCFWCSHKFGDGETMSIACPEKGSNKVLCHACADLAAEGEAE